MKILSLTLVTIIAMSAGVVPSSVLAQNRDLERRLASTTTLECSFSALATGDWNNGTAVAAVTPVELTAKFFDINVDEGTAEAESKFGASFIVVRLSHSYMHIMQMSDAGPLYLTTVYAREASPGRLLAIHTRHEYSPTKLPGFTSRPEMYIGTCAVPG